jgi:hypothetical protein
MCQSPIPNTVQVLSVRDGIFPRVKFMETFSGFSWQGHLL